MVVRIDNLLTDIAHEKLDLGAYFVYAHYDDYHYAKDKYWASGLLAQLRLWHIAVLIQAGRADYFGERQLWYVKGGVGVWI
ncbi:MAG: hypothetical protein HY903_11385 [Deltaproteobacteria bacterium]|nr:hypothetical protein [Deltaproteobacteria bacterium]